MRIPRLPLPSMALAVLTALVVVPPTAVVGDAAPRQQERTVYVEALDQSGLPITDLSADDLTVKEEGQVMPIVSVTPARGPIHLLILVDDTAPACSPTGWQHSPGGSTSAPRSLCAG